MEGATMSRRVVIASDHAGVELKATLESQQQSTKVSHL
jgi:hypothetical protein